MSNPDVIRAWKDAEYRDSLSEGERSRLPENPAGAVELPDSELDAAAGGTWTVDYVRLTWRITQAPSYNGGRRPNCLSHGY